IAAHFLDQPRKSRSVRDLTQRKTAGPVYRGIIIVYRRARIGLHKLRNNQEFKWLTRKRRSAESFQIEHRNHGRCYTKERRLPSRHSVGFNATRSSVAIMRVPATNVPRNVPETFDSPPVRLR